ncbi:MAG: hypothetical protein J7L44_02185 [Candidatus Diapherotrites archaeon]|nr:hypothetical protein [Candidatus Diapherotrites archaeon]
MGEVVIPIPKELEEDKAEIVRKLNEFVQLEAKRKMLIKLFNRLMVGAKTVNDKELVRFSKKFKSAGAKELEKKGLI